MKNFLLNVLVGFANHKKIAMLVFVFLLAIPVVLLIGVSKSNNLSEEAFDTDLVQTEEVSISATSTQKSIISIPAGVKKANPFVPYRDIQASTKVTDVPAFTLVEPPEMINENSDAARVMDTMVSGILYDKYSPSAILNIEGNDYLVKRGDVVNNYKVMSITQNSVTVKLGTNTYKAGIGEILTEGTVNNNDVANLNNKFGGKK
ncbi:MAG: hypothetical protein MJ237_07535 [bacterium]|nr:hypothetical protein [bacterium]